jgi:hypothetical protein
MNPPAFIVRPGRIFCLLCSAFSFPALAGDPGAPASSKANQMPVYAIGAPADHTTPTPAALADRWVTTWMNQWIVVAAERAGVHTNYMRARLTQDPRWAAFMRQIHQAVLRHETLRQQVDALKPPPTDPWGKLSGEEERQAALRRQRDQADRDLTLARARVAPLIDQIVSSVRVSMQRASPARSRAPAGNTSGTNTVSPPSS